MAGKSRHNRDTVIVEALARGEGQTAAATLAGCSVSTIRRRLDDAEFRDRVAKFRAEMLDSAAWKLGAAVTKAVATLESLLSSETPPVVRLGAAKAVVEFVLRSREASLEKRLADLEARARVGGNFQQYEERVAGRNYDELCQEIRDEAAAVTRRLG